MVSTALGHFQRRKLTPEVVWRRIYSNTLSFGNSLCSLCPKTLLLFPAPSPVDGWSVCAHCPALGAGGPCHRASAVFCTHPPLSHRSFKVKENLTPNVHCVEGSWSLLSPHFSQPFLGTLLATPSAFLLLLAPTAISAVGMQ